MLEYLLTISPSLILPGPSVSLDPATLDFLFACDGTVSYYEHNDDEWFERRTVLSMQASFGPGISLADSISVTTDHNAGVKGITRITRLTVSDDTLLADLDAVADFAPNRANPGTLRWTDAAVPVQQLPGWYLVAQEVDSGVSTVFLYQVDLSTPSDSSAIPLQLYIIIGAASLTFLALCVGTLAVAQRRRSSTKPDSYRKSFAMN